MEKEIYITEAPYHGQELNEGSLARQKCNQLGGGSHTEHRIHAHPFANYLPHESYYDDKKIKPGMTLLKIILDMEEKRANGQYSGPLLQMNIPETVVLTDNTNSLIYSRDGIVRVDSFVTNQTFLATLDLKQTDDGMFPTVVHSSVSGIGFNNSILMSNEVLANKIIPRSEGFICRRYVRPYADTPNILRLFYSSESQRSMRKNYGYKMVSNSAMDQQLFKRKHRQTHNYLVNPERQGSYSLTLIKGKTLIPFQQMAFSLARYLQKSHPIKITELILDFVVDGDKTPWLLQVRGIRSRALTKLWDIGNSEQIQLLTEKNNNSQLCRLCRMGFSKQELQKLVTNKLIWELTTHLQSRRIPFPAVPHLRKEGLSYVCSVCYELIVAEHQLIDVQKQFSALLSISSSTIERVPQHQQQVDNSRKLWEESDFQMSGPEMPKLKSWRLFFYIERIKYMDNVLSKPKQIALEMKFKNFKEVFARVVEEGNDNFHHTHSRFSGSYRAQSAVSNIRNSTSQHFRPSTAGWKGSDTKCQISQTTMASKISGSVTHSRESLDIQKVKVMVLYTKKHQPGNMFDDTELLFNLVIDDQKFEGRSFTLQQLKSKDTCQRHSSEVFLFNSNHEYCNLELTVGLICDGEADLDQLSLEEVDGIYYQKRPSSICLPLPDEWMQVFTKGQQVPGRSQELCYEDIHKQIPKMTKSKIRLKPLLSN